MLCVCVCIFSDSSDKRLKKFRNKISFWGVRRKALNLMDANFHFQGLFTKKTHKSERKLQTVVQTAQGNVARFQAAPEEHRRVH